MAICLIPKIFSRFPDNVSRERKIEGNSSFTIRGEERLEYVLIGEIKNLNYSLFHRILKIKNICILLYIKFFIFNALKDIYFFDAKIN